VNRAFPSRFFGAPAGLIIVRYAAALAASVGLLMALAMGSGEAQTTLETQRGVPPAPSAKSPEYAPSPVAPADRPSLAPSPGDPALKAAPGTIGDQGQPARAGGRRVLGYPPMTAFVVGLGLLGLVILVIAGFRKRPERRLRGSGS
jgi:hypothetical protein